MRPAKRLRTLASLTLAWAAVTIAVSPGAVWAQTTEAPAASEPPAAEPSPSGPAPAPAPGPDGKGFCEKNIVTGGLCAVAGAAKDFANGDPVGAAGELAGGVAAPVADAAVQAVQEGFA